MQLLALGHLSFEACYPAFLLQNGLQAQPELLPLSLETYLHTIEMPFDQVQLFPGGRIVSDACFLRSWFIMTYKPSQK